MRTTPILAVLALMGAGPTVHLPVHGRPASAGGLTGLYLQNQSIGRGNAWNYYYFWPDGHACHAIPRGGLDPAPSYAAVAARLPADRGTFAFGGGRLTLTLGGRAVEPLQVDRTDASGGFALSGFPTIRVPAFPAGARLDGDVLEPR